MNYFIAALSLIYFLSLIFWMRYLYIRSLSTAEDRKYTVKKIGDLIPYVPLGLQAAFLFCYGLFQTITISIKLSNLFDKAVLRNHAIDHPDLYPLKIMVTGFMIVAITYVSIKAASLIEDKVSKLLVQAMLFAASLFLLKVLVQNIYVSLQLGLIEKAAISYHTKYTWVLCLAAAGVLSFANGEWMQRSTFIKYAALASRILLLYCFIALLFALPRIIYLIVEAL